MSKIEHVSLNSEDEILDRVNSETLNYSGLYSKNSENENFETCSHLYLTEYTDNVLYLGYLRYV